ncbi:GNAT family protein [Amycolatopsis sp. QT-25]|uniref:GNAT family N-acetyltransferase n=1 Tax=Amycolatopsis sp. QT-25 TaxID=3034022 RepID=UPI0023EBF44C|nr:GNAT family protein [Amycolatopsis sp. QT-25]WET80215.1 GNAT family protein [Amycolatopsis sp. QT-25]
MRRRQGPRAANETAVGTIGLWPRKLSESIGIMVFSISPERRRRGSATDALKAITEFAWAVPGIERIEPWNHGSVRAAEKAGYRNEGPLPARHEIGGALRDMLGYVSPCTARLDEYQASPAGSPAMFQLQDTFGVTRA